MSRLTAMLLKCKPVTQRGSYWQKRFDSVCNRLVTCYGVPSLGNLDNPVWEIFYILLSAQTTEVQYSRAYRDLRRAYPTLRDLADASLKDVQECIWDCGLVTKRALSIIQISQRLLMELGSRPATRLRMMCPEDCFAFLTGLPGIGPKSALCVMMYSLGFDVFPVDVHVHRVAERIGALEKGLSQRQAQKKLPLLVPDSRCKELHITMLVHGRVKCVPQNPLCTECPIQSLCRLGRRRNRAPSSIQ